MINKFIVLLFTLFFFAFPSLNAETGQNKTIIDEWYKVRVPAPPDLTNVNIEAGSTALLILDMQTNICKPNTRPRCVSTIPNIKKLLSKARAKGILIVYSNTIGASPEDILKDLAPLPGDPVVKSSADKFYNTELENILKGKGIKTAIITGTSAHGAVLNTATGASERGFKVIIPVDGMSADIPYAEQYTAWHLVNSPATRRNVTLTSVDLLNF